MPALVKAGRYELREEIGRGAMGVVYHGFDPMIGRDVAVKTLHLSEAGTGMSREELVGRFQIEARAAGLLQHPNIVVVYDAGEEEGIFYITMELVPGRSLQALLDGHQLFPLPRIMHLMEQACIAIDYAHQHNVVHRDIKPANLMLTADDTLKITDFGTAKILQFGTAQTQHVMGTPSYMSPEQVKGKPVDGRSDVFSLGVILYEVMTGEKPFPGQNITTVIYKIINEEPIAPRALDSSIHEGLSTVITRALAKEPSARFQTCQELFQALKNYRNLAGPDSTPRRGLPVAASAAAAERRLNMSTHAPEYSLDKKFQDIRDADSMVEAEGEEVQQASAQELAAMEEQEQATRKRNELLLALILIAIIGFTGYRVWPAMRDLWHGLRTPPETLVLPGSSANRVNGDGQAVALPEATPTATLPVSAASAAAPPAVATPKKELEGTAEHEAIAPDATRPDSATPLP